MRLMPIQHTIIISVPTVRSAVFNLVNDVIGICITPICFHNLDRHTIGG